MATEVEKSRTVKRSRQNGLAFRLSLLARSFLLQAVWNPRGMQNVGFCFALMPLARSLSVLEKQKFMIRHLGFFNTNATMASYVIGAVARLEAEGRGMLESDDIKLTMGGSLGMAGDSLMWGAVRPAASLAAALIAISVLHDGAWSIWLAPVSLLAIYNVPHLYLRARGIWAGSRLGPAAAREVIGPGFKRVVTVARAFAAFGAGVVLAQAVIRGRGMDPVPLVGALLLLVLASFAARLRLSPSVVGLAGGLAWFLLLLLGGNGG